MVFRRLITLFVFLALALMINGDGIKYTDCGNGNLISAGIPSCNSDPCLFILGADVTVELNFTALDDAEHVEDLIKGIVRGKELPFPEPTKNLCDGYLTPGCPLKKGQDYVFRAIFKVKPFYPAIPIQVKHSLVDKNKKMVACTSINAKIIDGNPKKPRRRGGKSA